MLVRKALTFAMEAHKGQIRRKSNLPYVTHPISVYAIVKKHKESKRIEEILAASILHDVLEDCDVSFEMLRKEFGEMVSSLIVELTNDEVEKKRIGKEEYIKNKMLRMSNYALVIKLADLLDNASDNPTEHMLARIKNTILFLEENRVLTKTQCKICSQIKSLLDEYDEGGSYERS